MAICTPSPLPSPFQMTEEQFKSNAGWPDFMHYAWNFKIDELGCIWCINFGKSNAEWWCNSSRGTEEIKVDSWLVKEVCGGITVCVH